MCIRDRVNNAVQQTLKELTQRYDFKGSKSTVEIEGANIKVLTEDDMRLKSIIDILQSKFIRRGVAIKNLEYGKTENAAGGMVRQIIKIRQGIESDIAKKLTKDIKDSKIKVQTQFMDCLLYTSLRQSISPQPSAKSQTSARRLSMSAG